MSDEYFKSLNQLVLLLKEILTLTANPKLRKETPFERQVRLYESTYKNEETRSFDKHHAPLFVDLYKKYRKEFLSILDDDSFLRDEDCKVEVHFGKNNKVVEKHNIKLPLSVCYIKACKMYDDATEKLSGNDEKDEDIYNSAQYNACDELKYFLLTNIYNSLNLVDQEKHSKDLDSIDKIFDILRPETVNNKNEIKGSNLSTILEGMKSTIPTLLNTVDEKGGKLAADVIDTISSKIEDDQFRKSITDKIKSGNIDFRQVLNSVMDEVTPLINEKMPFSSEELPDGVTEGAFDKAREQINKAMDSFEEKTAK